MEVLAKSAAIFLVTLIVLVQLYGNISLPGTTSEAATDEEVKKEEGGKMTNIFDPSGFSSSFNNGQYEYETDGVRVFAKEARDPGVYFETVTRKVDDMKYFVFDIKGKLERLGQWCFPVVQVYDIQDDDYTPSVTKTSFTFKDSENTTIVVPLEGKIKTVSKIQFMLVTDRGSWDVNITNAHFE